MKILIYLLLLLITYSKLLDDFSLLFLSSLILIIYVIATRRIPKGLIVAAVLGVIIGNIHLIKAAEETNYASLYESTISVEGVVVEDPSPIKNGYEIAIAPCKINNSNSNTSQKIKLIVSNYHVNSIQYGDLVSFCAKLKSNQNNMINPFDFKLPAKDEYLGIMFIKGSENIKIVGTNKSWIKYWAIEIRKSVLNILNQNLAGPYNYLTEGLLIGNHQNGIPQEINDLFKKTGINHVLVVSGSQIALLSQITLLILLIFTDNIAIKFVTINSVNIIFVFLSGADPSVVRAALMMGIAQTALLAGRNNSGNRAMLITSAIMLSIDPEYIYNLGFILSFMATFGLISLAPIVEEKLHFISINFFRKMISIAIAPHLMTGPVILLFFSTYSLVSIPTNIVILPIVEFFVYAGITGIITQQILPIGAIIIWKTLPKVIELLLTIVRFFSNSPFANLNIQTTPAVIALIYSLIAFIFYKKARAVAFCLILICTLTIIAPNYRNVIEKNLEYSKKDQLELSLISVGNGLACLLVTPTGKTILMDAGGDKAEFAARKCIIPYLQKKGINKIDCLFISHAHADHYSAVEYVKKIMPVNELIVSNFTAIDSNYDRNINSLKTHRVLTGKGDEFSIDNIKIKIFSPAKLNKIQNAAQDELNNRSITAGIYYKNYSILFTGDAEEEETKYILDNNNLNKFDTIIIPHHGGKNPQLEALLKKTNPSTALISVGAQNKYHHPNKSTINTLNKMGIKTLRSDRNGTIIIMTDGNKILNYCNKSD